MKKALIISISYILINFSHTEAQVLNIPQVIQEQDQWCWAGVSKSILDFYGFPYQQCEIAEYTRTVITWKNFGSANCCLDPNQGCNYWNYNWGYLGSIQDILIHFGNIQNNGVNHALSLNEIKNQLSGGRPFVVRWQWVSGGGHFVVGHGVNGSDVYYMNPWVGEGLHITSYDWLVNDGNHTWNMTNILTTSPVTSIKDLISHPINIRIFPNPADGKITIESDFNMVSVEISNINGEKIFESKIQNQKSEIDLSSQPKGIYFAKISDGEKTFVEKIVIQ